MLFFAVGITAAPRSVLRALEDTYAPTDVSREPLVGAIILAGAEDAGVKAVERGQVLVNGGAERLITAARLISDTELRRRPHWIFWTVGQRWHDRIRDGEAFL